MWYGGGELFLREKCEELRAEETREFQETPLLNSQPERWLRLGSTRDARPMGGRLPGGRTLSEVQRTVGYHHQELINYGGKRAFMVGRSGSHHLYWVTKPSPPKTMDSRTRPTCEASFLKGQVDSSWPHIPQPSHKICDSHMSSLESKNKLLWVILCLMQYTQILSLHAISIHRMRCFTLFYMKLFEIWCIFYT